MPEIRRHDPASVYAPSGVRSAWANVVEVLAAAGMTVDNLVKVTTFLTDRSQIAANRAIRSRVLG